MMNLFKTIVLLFLVIAQNGYAQIDTASIKTYLNFVHDRDQKTRTNRDSVDFMEFFDNTNLVYVQGLIEKYGWPGISFVGKKGNQTIFLVIQHADLATQIKYFPLMKKSMEEGESNKADFALLQDRILMRQGKKQIYGSQVIYSDKGEPEFYQIADEKNVNERRANMGLNPIEEYAENFGIDYKPKE
jgi:hypothetical protein